MITPIGHKILVKPDPVETVSKGGIIMAVDEKLEKAGQMKGTLIAIGPIAWQAFRYVDETGKWKNGKPWAKVGDKVIYSKYAGKLLADPETEEDVLLLNDEDLVAIFSEGENKTDE